MPTLKRDDGVQFAIHTYRETLSNKKTSALKSEVRQLARNHGDYVRFFPHGDTLEAVFSRDPGFLLGETVWHYFNKVDNLIYCEALSESHQALIVIVRNGAVYLDTKIPFTGIADELASLITSKSQYDIYIYGDVPISDMQEHGKFVFVQDYIKSFNTLEQPLFSTLPLIDELQLQPIELALRAQRIGKRSLSATVITVACVLGLGGWWLSHEMSASLPQTQTINANTAEPYQGYFTALTSPAPEKQINEFAEMTNLLLTLPGWDISTVSFNGERYNADVSANGGNLEMLQTWTQQNNAHFRLTTNGVEINLTSKLDARTKPKVIVKIRPAILQLIDSVDRLLMTQTVHISDSANHGAYKEIDLSIEFTNSSPNILRLLGLTLVDLPIRLDSINANVENGLLSGNIDIAVFGK